MNVPIGSYMPAECRGEQERLRKLEKENGGNYKINILKSLLLCIVRKTDTEVPMQDV
jgi:hypothetical protein